MSKPSEKAMQAARDIQWEVIRGDDWTPGMLNHAASVIEKYAAEALAEHIRVIEMAEKALKVALEPLFRYSDNDETGDPEFIQASDALFEIARLKGRIKEVNRVEQLTQQS